MNSFLKRAEDGTAGPLASKLANVLYSAGRSGASCIVPKKGPTISFSEWVQRQIAIKLWS